MSLHAQIYKCHFTLSEKITITNISELLNDLIPQLTEIEELNESLQEVDLSIIPYSLNSVLHCNGDCGCYFRSYVLGDSILKLTLTIALMTGNGACLSFKKTFELITLNERLKSIYKETLNRHFSN